MLKNQQSILKISIPPRPEILLKMTNVMEEEDPDINQVISILKQDAGIYSIILAAVNSSRFGLKKQVTSIAHAITLLGLPRVFSMIKLVVLRSTLSKNHPMERFWDTATEVASITQELAARYTSLDPDNAYSIGMLHDCGIPILMQADPQYRNLLRQTNSHPTKELLKLETSTYGIEHFTLGAKLIRSWKMPPSVYKTIVLQASFPEVLWKYRSTANDCLMYLSLLFIAKDISKNYRHFWRLDQSSEPTPNIMACVEYIGLCDYDYLDLKEEYIEKLEQTTKTQK